MNRTRRRDSRFVVDLERSRSPRAFSGDFSLWDRDIKLLYRLVERHARALTYLEREEQEGKVHTEEHPHLSIAIFGPSGSGKSSLLRTIAADVGRPDSLLPQWLKNSVVSLPVMDPTTWGKSDQFLYAFLAAALEEERQRQTEKKHGYPQGLSPVQLAFQEVNEYLRVVDEAERHEEHDPLGLSLQKLERHTSGLRLRSALADLVKALAKELGAMIVLLPVDDLDMAPAHLIQSIQTYQSFLTHAHLVPIFTFTDRMPEELLEVDFRTQLGEGENPHGRDRSARLSISEQMAVQFLVRSFPVRNRIRLGPAPARVQRAVFRKSLKTEERMEVRELLTIASFLLFGHPDREDSHQVRAALRPSTLRRQFQVVDAMTDCQLEELRSLQLGVMAGLSAEDFEKSSYFKELLGALPDVKMPFSKEHGESPPREVPEGPPDVVHSDVAASKKLKEMLLLKGYWRLVQNLQKPGVDATWASIFNGASWSLLNVHRDTLRELGLFLEDLYSWSPKELRSVVLDNILLQDRATQRTVVDRWFNRTDYRRSQVLSVLAANIFRPWMYGEEPYGDEEVALGRQLQIERDDFSQGRMPDVIDEAEKSDQVVELKDRQRQIEERMTIPVSQGFLWFLNVTLGFYLPQIMARNWSEAVPDLPVKERMGGNGWDLQNASVHAVRLADAKQEILSFGMTILDNRGYRHALEFSQELAKLASEEASEKNPAHQKKLAKQKKLVKQKMLGDFEDLTKNILKKEKENKELHDRIDTENRLLEEADEGDALLLRLWTCCGYSFGRYWSAFSLWRGLGFIGQVLEVGWRLEEEGKQQALSDEDIRENLTSEISRLIRSHCLKGLVLGPLYSQSPKEGHLLHGFPPWKPEEMTVTIERMANSLADWLEVIKRDRIFPLPAGITWIGWRNCFIRRIHGEYILGALWPRINAAVLETQDPVGPLFAQWRSRRFSKKNKFQYDTWSKEDDAFRWTAATAANAWSDILLEYWRGSPSILFLLLSCPVFFKSRQRFGGLDKICRQESDESTKVDKRRELIEGEPWLVRLLRRDRGKEKERGNGAADHDLWDRLMKKGEAREKERPWENGIPGLVGSSLLIERSQTQHFGHSSTPEAMKIVCENKSSAGECTTPKDRE